MIGINKTVILKIECPDEETAIEVEDIFNNYLKGVLQNLISSGSNITVKRE